MSLRNTIRSIKRPDPAKVKTSVFGLLTNTSSIHGVKYIGDQHSPKITRTFWICAFLLSILGCIYYATQVYDKWYVTPDIGLKVQFNSSRTVPFPAITICPQTKVKAQYVDYKKVLFAALNQTSGDVFDSETRKYFEMAIQMCTIALVKSLLPEYKEPAELSGDELVSYISEGQFAINETIIGGRIDNDFHTERFERFVDRILTGDGFCVTYNLQDYSSLFKEDAGLHEDFDCYKNNRTSTWNPLDGYPNQEKQQFPKRIFSGKQNNVVFLLIQNKHDMDEACLGPDQGFKIYWHMPNEVPTTSHPSVTLGMEKSKRLNMKATQIRTSDDLLRYDIAQRRCYFEGEKDLRFFKSYTKSHCDFECLTNYTFSTCGCVKFFMPRTADMPVCDVSKLECAENAADNWLEDDSSYLSNSMPCKCYPSCAQIKYDLVSTIDGEFPSAATLARFEENKEFTEQFPTGQIARLIIEFEDFLIEAQENYLGYKMQHFISDCGGLLGLFMGCSILSLVEIFYQIFATIFMTNNTEVSDKSDEKPDTPLKDNRLVVLVEDGKENEKND